MRRVAPYPAQPLRTSGCGNPRTTGTSTPAFPIPSTLCTVCSLPIAVGYPPTAVGGVQTWCWLRLHAASSGFGRCTTRSVHDSGCVGVWSFNLPSVGIGGWYPPLWTAIVGKKLPPRTPPPVPPPPRTPPPYPFPHYGSLRSTRGPAPAPPLNNKTPAVATDRLLCAPPCVCTAILPPRTPPPRTSKVRGGNFLPYMGRLSVRDTPSCCPVQAVVPGRCCGTVGLKLSGGLNLDVVRTKRSRSTADSHRRREAYPQDPRPPFPWTF